MKNDRFIKSVIYVISEFLYPLISSYWRKMLKFAEVLNQSISTPRRNLSMNRLPILTFIAAIVATLSIFLASCGGRNATPDRQLADAEEIMEARPDSAYSILTDSIDSIALRSATRRQQALYALLITQANDKCRIQQRDDSLVSTAVKYFESKGDAGHLMKSLFYQAVLQNESGDGDMAILALIQAKELAEELGDNYWQARVLELTGHILNESYSREEALSCYEKAAELYRLSGREDFYMFSILDKINILNALMRYSDGHEIIEKIKDERPGDAFFKSYLGNIAMAIYSKRGDKELAEMWADSLMNYREVWEYPSETFAGIAGVKISVGNIETGKQLIDSAKALSHTLKDTIFFKLSQLKLYKRTGAVADALSAVEDILGIQNEILYDKIEQSVVKAQRDHYAYESEINGERAERQRLLLICALIIAGMFALIMILIYRNRIYSKNSEINRKIAELLMVSSELKHFISENQALSNQLSKQKSDVALLETTLEKQRSDIIELSQSVTATQSENRELQASIGKLLNGRFAYLDMLVSEYTEKENNDSPQALRALYKNLKKEIDRFNTPKNLSEIVAIVNRCKNNILDRMKEQIPSLSESDIIFLALTLAGFGAKAIGLVAGMKPNSTYNKKRNLVKLIKESDAYDKDWFLEELAKV